MTGFEPAPLILRYPAEYAGLLTLRDVLEGEGLLRLRNDLRVPSPCVTRLHYMLKIDCLG